MPDEYQTVQDEIERLIDRNGVSWFVAQFVEVCHAKAEHVRANWQDEPLAKTWERLAAAADRLPTGGL